MREVERISKVYEAYRSEGRSQTLWSEENLGNQIMEEERHAELAHLLERAGFLPLDGRKVLDVGCGDGHVLAGFTKFGAQITDLHGIDLLGTRIAEATERYPEISFTQANAEHLPFESDRFDLVLAFTVFSSIFDDEMSLNIAQEMRRVLKSDGAIVWYDLRYGNPLNRRVRGLGVGDIEHLFPDLTFSGTSITLLPPLTRRLTATTKGLYPILSSIPLIRTHYLALLSEPGVQKPSTSIQQND